MFRRLKSLLLILALVGAPVAFAGCGGSGGRGGEVVDPDAGIKGIFDAYQTYYRSHQQKSPTKLSDLTAKGMGVISEAGVAAAKSGKFVIVFGIPLQGKGSGDPETVLAYEKEAPANGGRVIMADGALKTMSAANLSAKIKK